MRDVAISSYKETGEKGVVNSGDSASRDIVVMVVPWHGHTTPFMCLRC